MPHLSRREFLQATALASLGLCTGLPASLLKLTRHGTQIAWSSSELERPLREIQGPFVSGVFNGDDVSRPHDILWDREGYIRKKGGRPTSFGSANVVVVGGGMAGLLSTYLLRDLSPVLLEQAPSFGGNSKGESFQGTAFSCGAAYLTLPEAGGEIETLLKELGLHDALRKESSSDARILLRGNGLKNIWAGDTGAGKSAREVEAELSRIYQNAYPEIPWTPASTLTRDEFDALDRENAHAWLRRKFPDLHPHVEEYFQLYSWSSFGGSLTELSAAQFLNFAASETEGVVALPGGNAAITNALYLTLSKSLPSGSLRAGSIVLEVKDTPQGVEILFEDKDGNLRLIRAKAAVMAAPKYVARFIVPGLQREREEFWKSIRYRAYVVANVQLSVPVPQRAFDVFCIDGKVPEEPSFQRPTNRPWSDFIYAGWAARQEKGSILTLYKPFPFEGARNLLTSNLAHARIKSEIEKFLPDTLQELGIAKNSISGMRITRWAHAIPLAETGKASSAGFDQQRAPHGKIAFANQDNYVSPAFESCFSAAREASDFARATI